MIESIRIQGAASYDKDKPVILDGLSPFNYFYGANGTGKTTVSRVIAGEPGFDDCLLVWRGGTKLETLVYNRDFIDRNFGQDIEIKGIFTLGEQDKSTLHNIAAAKSELDAIVEKITGYTETLQGVDGSGGKTGELVKLESEFEEACWKLKQKHDAKLKDAFTGVRSRKQDFKERMLREARVNTAILKPLAELEERAETVFGEAPEKVALIPEITGDELLALESSAILKKKVIGKTDVDIAAMIQKLGNSDWVKDGRPFLDVNDGVCPFCQQKTAESLAKSLNDYFDEQFENDTNAINQLLTDYTTESARILQSVQTVLDAPSTFLELDKLKMEKEVLASKVRLNIEQIKKKQKESSQSIELESLANVLDGIKTLISDTNTAIRKHNEMVSNLVRERKDLTEEAWKYLLESAIKDQMTSYATRKDGLEKAIDALQKRIGDENIAKNNKQDEIKALEKNATSIQPTIDDINSLLSSFGFHGFSLAKSKKDLHYEIVRADGSAAKETLSEGERSFVTFLYFYHLLNGSETETGMTTDRVVVFDDPVSSLDSDVLFIVSNLIKGIFDEVREGDGHIKQVFVLTHNVYFHKEVTFSTKRPQGFVMSNETFWLVKKYDRFSTIEKQDRNPITTTYELLWQEVRDRERSNLSIQNTLRRILEHYFKILGNTNLDELCEMFEEKEEKVICRSLLSWINDGSHSAHGDFYVSTDDNGVAKYLAVFRNIFEKSGNEGHYRMMMGDAFAENVAAAASSISMVGAT